MKIIFEKKKSGDRCTRIAKRKYDVWPSAYASGAVVKCRQGKIWKGLSEEQLTEEILNIISEELEFFLEKKKKKPDFKKEKESGLHGWFSRKGGKGGKGWVDCNTCRTDKETGKKTCKTCGRQEGEKRSKYPACRPKPSDCGSSGKGKDWGKKSESVETDDGLLEEDRQYLKNIILNELHHLFEVEESDPKVAATKNIKDAEKILSAAKKETQAEKAVSDALPSDTPEMNNSKKAGLLDKKAKEKLALKNVKQAKEAAQDLPVTEETEKPPQPGESSGKAKDFKSDAEPVKKMMTIGEIISQHPDIPYYKDVLGDYKLRDYSWAVTAKVLEYAKYLKNNPESVKNLPPIIFINNNINDGAHRTSALYLLANELDKNNPFWKQVKLKVYFYDKKDVLDTVKEEKSNFQKEMEKKGKGWKVRLLTKGKQPAGSAYPNKAPTDRAKSAPPGAGGV